MLTNLKKHIVSNTKLALPVTLGNVGQMVTSITDTIMVGQLGATQLAAVGFANSVFMFPFLVGVGIATGITAVTGKANAEGNQDSLSSYFFNGHWLMFLTSIAISLILLAGAFNLESMGQDPNVADISYEYILILISSVMPYFIFLGFKQFWEGLQATTPGMIIIIACNLLNILLNYLLIFGEFGFPELGLNGAGWATAISRVAMLISAIILMYGSKRFSHLLSSCQLRFNIQKIQDIFKIGFPIGLQVAFEVGAFSAGVIIAGFINEKAQAAHKIALDLAALTFMMASGIGSAATISISNYLGSKNYQALKESGRSVAILAFTFMCITCVVFLLTNDLLPSFYTKDIEVMTIASSLLVVAAFFQISDGLQVTMIGTLRGLHDVNYPTIMTLIGYWVFAIPVSYVLAIELNFGPEGIWYGYLTGLTIVAIGLIIRFEKLAEKKLRNDTDW